MSTKYTMIDPVDLLTGETMSMDGYTVAGPWMPVGEPPARAREGAPDSKIVMLRMEVGGKTIETPGWYSHEEHRWYVWGLYKGGEITNWTEAKYE